MRALTLVLTGLLPLFIQAQVWQENFDNGCATGCSGNGYASLNGVWSVTNIGVNGVNANQWFVSCAEDGFLAAPPCANACSSPAPGNATAHIGNVSSSTAAFLICPGGDCRALYDDSTPAEATSTRLESPIISTVGFSAISLNMIYFLGGVNCATDYAAIDYFDGTSWSVLVPCLPQTVNNCTAPHTGSYNLAYTVALPVSANNNPSIRLGFRWENDGNGTGTDPSFTIDNLVITNGALASDMEDFSVLPTSDAVQVRWVVRQDAGIIRYVLERSADGKDFADIAELPAREGNGSITYAWTDARPLGGKSYYRIRQEYVSGEKALTQVIPVNRTDFRSLTFESSNLLSRSEKPVVQVYSDRNRTVQYLLTDMTGRQVATTENMALTRGYQEIELSRTELTPGWYALTLISDDAESGNGTAADGVLRVRLVVQ